jgi:hypothetical protein
MPELIRNVTDATLKDFYKQAVSAKQEMEKISEEMRSATGRYRAVLKAAKNAGIDPDDITYAVKLRHLDRSDLIRQERGRARMVQVSGLWPKIQMELFSTDTPLIQPTADDSVEVAYDNGHKCGVKGELRTINPYSPGTEQWAEFDRGWSVGQEKNAPGKGRKRGKSPALKLVEPPPDEPPPVEPLFG